MKKMNRRTFLRNAVVTSTGLCAFPHFLANAASANEQVRIAVAGINSQGNGHIDRFQKISGVRIAALIDPDQKVLDQRIDQYKKKYSVTDPSAIQGYNDVRKVLERKDIDAIVIATPNHWHSLMTIWACQAGKHVYVEKPVSHSIWEGRKMVEAARKYNRIVQAGTQQRSCPAVQEAARDIQAGKYGKVLWVHCSKLQSRATIGKVTTPTPVPAHIDHNLWAGPAPMTPIMRKQLHYDWHWQWNWGDGEMGNWGVHYLDDIRHLLGWKNVPTKMVVAGNRFVWDDNGETPNMHFALFDYDGIKLVVDIRNLPDPERPGDNEGAIYLQSRGGNYIQCENAFIRLSRGGGAAFDKDGKRILQYKGDGGSAHAPNFINAIRSGSNKGLNAEIEVGHYSSVICHQANIGFRLGKAASVEEARETMKVHEDALNTLNDMLEQLKGNQVDIKKTPFMVGPELVYNREKEQFVGNKSEEANRLVRVPYREGFVIKDTV